VAEIPAGDFDIEAWWRVKQAQFPALSTALRSVLCHIPNSAPPERLFSILNDNIGDDQLRAKADYKMALCVLVANTDTHNQAPCTPRLPTPPVLSRVTFMRVARAPAAGHSTHFNPQHWLLCHMGLY
jgi:hypothetical protein